MFSVDDIVAYKGHGLVRIVGIQKRKKSEIDGGGEGDEAYYLLKSSRAPLAETRMMVKVEGSEKALRRPMNEEEAKAVLELMSEEAAELPEDHMERMRIMDEVVAKNELKDLASLVRDYRESRLLNLERVEIHRIKAIARNIAEEICHVLSINRPSLHRKFSIRSV